MSSGYLRQAAANISSGLIINADDFNAEYNQIQAAFDGTSGHDHTGGVGLGPKIGLTNAVTGILPSANGGTGSAFITFAGPTALRTYTLPNSNATLLTTASTLGVANGGTGQVTANAAFNAFAPSQATNSGKYLTTDGTNTSWVTISAPAAGFADPGGNGIVVRTALNTSTNRTITGTAGTITVTNGDGTAGNPTLTISGSYVGQSSITTLGTITTGVWNGTKLGLAYGGTNLDMTATGGTSKFLKQNTLGGAVTVTQPTEADLSLSDITTNDVSTSKHGLAPKLPNDATKYLDGTGAYSAPTAGAMVLLSTQTISSSTASVSVTAGINSTYSHYIWEISNLTSVSNAVDAYITIQQGGVFVGGTSYFYNGSVVQAGSVSGAGSSGSAQFIVDLSRNSLNTTTPCTIKFEFWNPAAALELNCIWAMLGSAGAAAESYTGAGNVNTTAASTGIKLVMSSGNIATCTAKLYGVV